MCCADPPLKLHVRFLSGGPCSKKHCRRDGVGQLPVHLWDRNSLTVSQRLKTGRYSIPIFSSLWLSKWPATVPQQRTAMHDSASPQRPRTKSVGTRRPCRDTFMQFNSHRMICSMFFLPMEKFPVGGSTLIKGSGIWMRLQWSVKIRICRLHCLFI